MRVSVVTFSCILLFIATTQAVDLTAFGSYSETINAADLTAGAGSDLMDTYQSTTSAVTLTVSNSMGGSWAIDVRKSDTTWNGSVIVKVKKTTGAPVIRTVGSTDMEFFQGAGDGSFHVQVIVEGVSIAVAPNVYSTTVMYTVRGL